MSDLLVETTSVFKLIRVLDVHIDFAIVDVEDISTEGSHFYALIEWFPIKNTPVFKKFDSMSYNERLDNIIDFIKSYYSSNINIIDYVKKYYKDDNFDIREFVHSNMSQLYSELENNNECNFLVGIDAGDVTVNFLSYINVMSGSNILLFGDKCLSSDIPFNCPVILEKDDDFGCMLLYFNNYIPNKSLFPNNQVTSWARYSILSLNIPLDGIIMFIDASHIGISEKGIISLYKKLSKDYKNGRIDSKIRRRINNELFDRYTLNIKRLFFGLCISSTTSKINNFVTISLGTTEYNDIDKYLWNGDISINTDSYNFHVLRNVMFPWQFRNFIADNYIFHTREWFYWFLKYDTEYNLFDEFMKYFLKGSRTYTDLYIIKFLTMIRYNRKKEVFDYKVLLEDLMKNIITINTCNKFFMTNLNNITDNGMVIVTFNEHGKSIFANMNTSLEDIYNTDDYMNRALNTWLGVYPYHKIKGNEIHILLTDKLRGNFDIKPLLGIVISNMYESSFIRFEEWYDFSGNYSDYYTLGDLTKDIIFNKDRVDIFKQYVTSRFLPTDDLVLPKLSSEGSIFADIIYSDISDAISFNKDEKYVDISPFVNTWKLDSYCIKRYKTVIISAVVSFLVTVKYLEVLCGDVCDIDKFDIEYTSEYTRLYYRG